MSTAGSKMAVLTVTMIYLILQTVYSTNIKVLIKCRTADTGDECKRLGIDEEARGPLSLQEYGCQDCECSRRPDDNQLVVDCSYLNKSKIPVPFPNDTAFLHLDHNEIKHVPACVFHNMADLRLLDLSHNQIEFLTNDSFTGLESLHVLNLRNNSIRYIISAIPKHVFQPLKTLTALHLDHMYFGRMQVDLYSNESFPIWALHKLINLQNLTMDGLNWTRNNIEFDSNFSSLINLEELELTGRCYLPEIKTAMFKHVPFLKSLDIKCHVKTVQNRSFAELTMLKHLDISSNFMTFRALHNISFGLQSTQIEVLNFSAVYPDVGFCTVICAQDLMPLNKTNLKRLYLESNRLAGFHKEAFPYLPSSLELLSLRDNQISFLFFTYLRHNRDILPNLKTIVLSDQNQNPVQRYLKTTYDITSSNIQVDNSDCGHPVHSESPRSYMDINTINGRLDRYNPFDDDHCSECPKDYKRIEIPQSVEILDLTDMRVRIEIHKLCLCTPNSLKILKLSRNIFWKFTGPFLGLHNLTYLDISWNSCEEVSSNILEEIPNLRFLNFSKNYLGYSVLSKDDGTLFKYQKRLQTLDLSDNKIHTLPKTIFLALESLTCLFLGNNKLKEFDVDISSLRCLQYLDLTDNYLKTLPGQVTLQFERLKTNFTIFVDLSDNRLCCTCKDTQFIDWMSSTTQVQFINQFDYTCKYENDSQLNMALPSQLYDTLSKQCQNYRVIIIVVSSILSIFVSGILVKIVYRYRWDLRYLYYSTKIKHNRYRPSTDLLDPDGYVYDAFVSYCETDSMFVKHHLVAELEDKRGLKLLIHDRDFIAGNGVAENIVKAIMSSRRTLVILSNDFLQSNWCVYEMNMAISESVQTRRNLICFVKKEEVSMADLSLEIIEAIRKKTYLGFPEDEANMDHFWDRLHDALTE